MRRLAHDPARHPGSQGEQGVKVDAGLAAHGLQHEGQVLRGRVPAGARRMRAAADAGQRGIEAAHTHLQRGQHVGQRQSACVVEVAAPDAVAGESHRLLEQATHRDRVRIAHRVGHAHAVGTGIEQGLHQPQHLGRLHPPLQRAAECRADTAFDECLAARGVTRCTDPPEFGHDLVRRLAQVGQTVRVTGRQRQDHQVGIARQRRFGSAKVRHEDGGEQAWQRLGEGQDVTGVGHLGEQLRGHERTDLDLAHASTNCFANPCALTVGCNDGGKALQAVPQADLADDDIHGHDLSLVAASLI